MEDNQRFSRREFLKLVGLGAGTSILAACAAALRAGGAFAIGAGVFARALGSRDSAA